MPEVNSECWRMENKQYKESQVTRYKSKIDNWLVVILVATMAVCMISAAPLLFTGSIVHTFISIFILTFGSGLPLSILLATWYDVDDHRILIRSGPFKWSIPIAEIKALTPSRSLISGPALSTDRVRIDYGKWNSVLVSPKDKAAFIQQIENNIAAKK